MANFWPSTPTPETPEPPPNRLRDFFFALPALLVGITLVVGMILVGAAAEGELLLDYRAVAAAAMRQRDFQNAQMCYERLVKFYGTSYPEYNYDLALTDLALKQNERGVYIMRTLADPDKQGYGPAHVWHAGLLMANDNKLTEAESRAAEMHLRRALQADPDSLDAHALAARLYVATRRFTEAAPHLEKVVEKFPDMRVDLARCYKAIGTTKKAHEEASRAAAFYADKVSRNLDDHAARMRWADALQIHGNYKAAANVLAEGNRMTPDPRYRPALAQLYALQANQMADDPWAKERFELLEDALKLDAGNVLAIEQLFNWTRISKAEAASAKAKVQQLLSEGTAPAFLHLLLGYQAIQDKQLDAARLHFEQALKREPKMAMAANNLAVILGQLKQPNLPRALELVNGVLEQFPNQGNFLETRGQIYIKMRQWNKALTDLEAALPKLSKKSAVHASLAVVYQELGMPELAAEHRRRAEEPRIPDPRKIGN